MIPTAPRPFLCRVPPPKGYWSPETDYSWSTIYAFTRSKARYQYFLDISDCCPDLKLHQIEVKSGRGCVGDSERFLRTAKYRGREELHQGSRVKVGTSLGWVVGSNCSANFDVLFDEDSEYKGNKLNVHPSEIELVAG